MKGEIERNEEIEEETLRMAAIDYAKNPPQAGIQQLISKHQKEIQRLELLKKNPIIEESIKAQKRQAVLKHMAEKRKINEAVNMQFEQMDINRSKNTGAI